MTAPRRGIIPEHICKHDTKGLVVFEDGKLRCDGCYGVMVFVPAKQLARMMRTPTEVEADLKRENAVLRSVLMTIHRTLTDMTLVRKF